MQTILSYITVKTGTIATVALGVLLFLYYVWPTPFFYMVVKLGPTERIVEVNRFTSETRVIYPHLAR